MLLPCLRSLASQFTDRLRPLIGPVAVALALLLAAAPRAAAQSATAAEIAPAALPGKTLTLNSVLALAPFAGTGVFTITFTDTTYTMPVAAGNPAAYSGTYSAFLSGGATVVRLNGYLVSGSPVLISLVPGGAALIPGTFAMAADGVAATKSGTFTISGGATGGGGASTGGAPVVTSATTATATVGTPFVYQITTSPAATSYTNTGGNAPVAISPGSGLVTGTFTTAGTFSFSFTALNAAGASAVTTVRVTATAGATGGGSTPVITSPTTANATVGTRFTYQIAASGSPTGYRVANAPAWLTLNPATGLLSGTPDSSATNSFTVFADNAAGAGSITLVVTARVVPPTSLASYAGTYTGALLQRIDGVTSVVAGATHRTVVTTTGAVTTTIVNGASTTTLTGNVALNGFINYTGGTGQTIYRIANAGIVGSVTFYLESTFFVASTGSTGARTEYALQTTTSFVPAGATTPTVATAPANLVGYRNRVGSVFEFTVTGSTGGSVWGTEVYTDDSSVARAAVHAGVLAVGETRTVTVTILPGQPSYPASTRNGVASASWGSWAGSFAFAGAGAVTSGTVAAATARPAVAPGFTAATATLAAGGRLVCPIAVTGGGTYTYQWYLNNVLIPGATANPYIVETLTTANAGTYSVDVTNALGTTRLTAGTVVVGSAGSPVLALQPVSKNVVPGGTFTVAASATGSGLSYQWFRNGTQLAGETGAILLRNNANASDAGNYTVRIANANGAVTSNAATITLSPDASRPANISVRTAVATGATVIPGFVVQGTGTKRVLIRAVGPGLAAFGLGGTMADPKLTVFQGSSEIATNDNWSAAAIGNAFSATGAFALPAGSRDAALLTDLPAGRDYTVQVTNASGSGGIVLIEVYDADALRGTSTSKLVNVSVRGQTAPGDDVLTLGLVIGGAGPRTLLVRGIGPRLAAFGVSGTVADPRLQIFDSQQRAILANDDWGSADFVSELALATTYVGAFPLEAGSRDAATLSLVQPGAYTIQVVGATAAPTGEALVEVYEVP
jgi:hypothetical protein